MSNPSLAVGHLTGEEWEADKALQGVIVDLVFSAASEFYRLFPADAQPALRKAVAGQCLDEKGELQQMIVARTGRDVVGIISYTSLNDLPLQRKIGLSDLIRALDPQQRPPAIRALQAHGASLESASDRGSYISRVAVTSQSRSTGVATALMRFAVTALKDQPIGLHVARENSTALALYKRFGFSHLRRGAPLPLNYLERQG